MLDRPPVALPAIALSISGIAGMLHGTWMVGVVGACALFFISQLRRRYAAHLYPTSHRALPDTAIVLSSVLNASVVSAAAFVLGRVTGLVWGV